MNILKTAALMLSLLATAAIAACSAYPRTEADFGAAARHMADRTAYVSGPVDPTPVETGDGERINNVIEVYRSNVSRPQEVEAPIVLDIGSSGRR